MKYYWKKIEVLVFLAEIKVFLTEINEAAPGKVIICKMHKGCRTKRTA